MVSELVTLRAIKIVHTAAWALFAGCILAIPFFAWRHDFTGALILIVIVSVEVVIILANHGRCPLTGVAARYTQDRRDNFDICLPLWLARYNKQIFGLFFLAGLLFTFSEWHGLSR